MQRVTPTARKKLYQFYNKWKACTSCNLHENKRNYVFWRGELPCRFLFIGEAPGEVEDLRGYPFVGPSGDYLQSIIDEAELREYAITNVVCCCPLKDLMSRKIRQPDKTEIEACSDRLIHFIQVSQPNHIFLVGKVAQSTRKTLHKSNPEVRLHDWHHPAYLLRQSDEKREVEFSKMVAHLEYLKQMEEENY